MNATNRFETIVSEYYEPLYKFAMSLTRSESDAKDLTQQTFYVWATKGHQLRDPSKVKAWLFTTLHRVFLAARHRQARFPHLDLDESTAQLPVLAPVAADRVDSSQALCALAKVDQVFQAAVALFYLEDWSYKDIARILEVPVGTVKSRLARGIAQLREILLSDNSDASSLREDRISSNPMTGKPAALRESCLPSPRRRAQPEPTRVAGGYTEWDLSSTLLQEPLGSF